jgi:hypothetical protein
MSAPNTTTSGVGLRWVQLFELNSTGSPNASGTTVYEGIQIEGAKALTLNAPTSRQITHVGDDGVIAVDKLPPTDASSGTLTTAKQDNAVEALMTGNKEFTISDGEAKAILMVTDNQGYEPQVGILAYRQSLDTEKGSATYGKRVWDWYILPKAFMVPKPDGFSDSPVEKSYDIFPQVAGGHLWETAFTDATEGAVQGQFVRGISEYPPIIASFLGNNTTTAFLFNTAHLAVSAAKISVWVNGVATTTGITKATTGVTFTTAPTTSARIVVLYEKASA